MTVIFDFINGGCAPKQAPAGNEKVFADILRIIVASQSAKNDFPLIFNKPPGILLHGVPGVGKTFMARAVAAALGYELRTLSACDLTACDDSEAVRRLGETFEAPSVRPTVLFLDDLEIMAAKRADAERANPLLLTTLLTLMDGFANSKAQQSCAAVAVLAATCNPDILDDAVRRPGRFDREIRITPPNRTSVLQYLTAEIPLTDDAVQFLPTLAIHTPGYVPGDLHAILREAASDSAERSSVVDAKALAAALRRVPPSMARSHVLALGAQTQSWASIGGLTRVKDELQRRVLGPLCGGARYSRLGVRPPRGLLLFGPPGCSKTTIARILANELGYAFYALSPADVYDCYVGEAARKLRAGFELARRSEPAILFLDEIDTLVGSRDSAECVADTTQTQILSTLLNEIDGVDSAGARVLVVGAANHPERLDAALTRVGRLEHFVYLGPPDLVDRMSIFRVYLSKMPLAAATEKDAVDVAQLAARCERATGAEIEDICRETALLCLRSGALEVSMYHFESVLKNWRPGLTESDVAKYAQNAVNLATK